jgi:hypothetical protein
VEEQGEGQRGVGSGGQGTGAARGAEKSSAGQLELGHMAGEGSRVGQRENRERRTGGRRRRTWLQFVKNTGTPL